MNTWKKKIIIIPQWSQYNCEVALNSKKKCHFIICWAPLCIHLNWTQYTLNWLKNVIFFDRELQSFAGGPRNRFVCFQNFGEAQNIDCSHTFISFDCLSLFSVPDYFFCISLSCNIYLLIMGIWKNWIKEKHWKEIHAFFLAKAE